MRRMVLRMRGCGGRDEEGRLLFYMRMYRQNATVGRLVEFGGRLCVCPVNPSLLFMLSTYSRGKIFAKKLRYLYEDHY